MPTIADAAAVWRLVNQCGVLDTNSCYAYLLLFRDFPDTCRVALAGERVSGFLTAYIPPARNDRLFVWQVGVAESARRMGLGKQMLRSLLASAACRDVQFIEATVTESNAASQRLFRSMAEELSASVATEPCFRAVDFGGPAHEDEPLLRIGPFNARLGAEQ